MPEIVDLDELVPDDIEFKYRKESYTIPGDLKTGVTLEMFALLQRLARAEATGTPAELKRIITQAERALLPIFQIHQPDMVELPFGARALGLVLRKVLALIGLLQTLEGDGPNPPVPPNRAARRKKPTRTTTKRSSPKRSSAKRSAGSTRSPSS